jgi:Hint domain
MMPSCVASSIWKYSMSLMPAGAAGMIEVPLHIKWIGRQIFRRSASLRWPDSVHPICVARSALVDNVPHANLYLSPLHALFIDGVLIQVGPLVAWPRHLR